MPDPPIGLWPVWNEYDPWFPARHSVESVTLHLLWKRSSPITRFPARLPVHYDSITGVLFVVEPGDCP